MVRSFNNGAVGFVIMASCGLLESLVEEGRKMTTEEAGTAVIELDVMPL
jgi:hypothetical protein